MIENESERSQQSSLTTIYTRFLFRISGGKAAATLFVALMLLLGSVNLLDFPFSVPYMRRVSGFSYLDMQGFYSAERAYAILKGMGETGRGIQFHLLYTLDILIPLLSFLAGSSVIAYLFRTLSEEGRRFRFLALLPLFAALFDYMENAGILMLLLSYPDHLNGVAQATGVLTLMKTVLYWVVLLLMAIGAIRRAGTGLLAKREVVR